MIMEEKKLKSNVIEAGNIEIGNLFDIWYKSIQFRNSVELLW